MIKFILITILTLSQVACARGYNYVYHDGPYYPHALEPSPHPVYPHYSGGAGHPSSGLSASYSRDLKYAISNNLYARQLRYRINGRR